MLFLSFRSHIYCGRLQPGNGCQGAGLLETLSVALETPPRWVSSTPSSRWVLGTICWMKSRTASEATRLGAPSRSQDCSDFAPSPLHRKVLYSLNPQVSPGDQRLATWPLWITGRVEAMSFLTARGRGPAEWGLEEVPPLN